jgi:hypothetical protein
LGPLVLATACQNGTDGDGTCPAGLLPGDLVISEIMANPPSADAQQEWFEIYNATSSEVNLEGLVLVSAQEDGASAKSHTVGAVTLAAGEYLVVGNMIEEVRPDHVDYGYGNDLGDMRNTAGRLAIGCGETEIDKVVYLDPSDGASRGFDGTQAPDAVANDSFDAWCDATTEYEAGAAGSPGAANEPCGGSGQGTCLDGDESRDVQAPAEGDLIITEYMPNPEAVGDPQGEWFEVYATADVDLNGLEIGKEFGDPDDTLGAAECLAASAGDYIVFARLDDDGTNGGIPQVDHTFSFAVSNSNSGLFLGHGGELVDEVSWTSSSAGAATSLHPDRFDSTENDDQNAWCVAVDAYGDGDLGTPGGANPECEVPPPDGMCEEDGELREVVPPSAGDIVISEFMPNPDIAGDSDGEWFELYVGADIDLNGLELGNTAGDVKDEINPTECLPVTSGSYVVIARSDDSLLNGALPQVDALFGFNLTNTAGSLFVGYDGAALDEVSWTASSAGAATSLDPDSLDTTANDDENNWCDAVDAYGDGDLGTPGDANPMCGGGGGDGMCNDGNEDRPVVKPQAGDLVITEYMANPDLVTDANGEWIELYATKMVDLNGLQLGNAFGDVKATLDSASCITVDADNYALLARDSDSQVNGGLPAVDGTFSFSLVNSNSGVFIGIDDGLLDDTTHTSSPAGKARSLDPDQYDTTANDQGANWCDATDTYGDGDFGTPKAGSHPQCQ